MRASSQREGVAAVDSRAPLLSNAVVSLLRRQLVLVTGKGGVGKTLVTALLGQVFTDAGRRVLLIETDPRENLHQMLAVAPSGGDIVSVRPGLFLQNLQPRQVLEDLVRERLHVGMLARRVLGSPVFDHFVEAAPGLKQLALLGYALQLVRGERRHAPAIDMVVLDAPASGHAASLVTAPQLVSGVIQDGPFGRLAAELSEFMRDGDRTGIVAVTKAEEMPVQEVIELRATLEAKFGRGPELLVVNGLFPTLPSTAKDALQRAGSRPADDATAVQLRLWRVRRGLNDRELQRLDAGWNGVRIELPLVPLERGPALVAALRPAFEAANG